jgi:beta-lactamase class A
VRRRPAAVAVVLAVIALLDVAAPSSADAASRGERWRPDMTAARAYAAGRAGGISFAVRTPHHMYQEDAYRPVSSASVVKAMLMVAYLNHAEVRDRALVKADRELLDPMVRWSSNLAATRVRDFVGNGALEHLARRVGMKRFSTATIWGSTQITAADQTKLFLKIDRYVVKRHRALAMRLLGNVVGPQRWGIGRARPASWALYFKGGWGDGSGSVDHQVALLRRGRRRVSVAILTTGNPSHEYGKETLRGISLRLLRTLGPRSAPR